MTAIARRADYALRLACAVAFVGFGLWEGDNLVRERQAALDDWQSRLEATADDRERAIDAWLAERRHDLELVATYPSIRAMLGGHGEVDHRLRQILQSTVSAGSFESFALFDRTGAARITLGAEKIPTEELPPGWTAIARSPPGSPRIASIRGPKGSLRLAFLTPVDLEPETPGAIAPSAASASGDLPVGSLVATVDPGERLFALLGRDLSISGSGESLLVARRGAAAVYLSPLRHAPPHSGAWREVAVSLDPAAEIALAPGIGRGERADYRGITTLVATRRLSEAPWGLLVKIDRREALAVWRAATIRRLATWAMALAATLLLLWGRQRSRRLQMIEESADRDAKYRLLMEQAGDAIFFVRPADGRILEANRAAERMYGLSGEALRELSLVGLHAPAERAEGLTTLAAAAALAPPGRLVQETVHRDAEGRTFPVEVSIGPAEVGGETVLLEVVRDTRERWAAIERIERLNRTLSTTSQINQLIAHERDRDRLLREACRIFVDSAGLRMAWIGRVAAATPGEPSRVVPVAWAGLESGYLATADLPLDAAEIGPARQAILEGRAVTRSAHGLRPEAWSRAAEQRGFRSSAAAPMSRAGQIAGVIAVYSEVPDFFHADSLAMLEDLAGDLELALTAIEAETALAESAARYRALFESSPQPMWVHDVATLRFLAVNDAAVRCYGWSRDELLAMTLADLRPPDPPCDTPETGSSGEHGIDDDGIRRHRRKDGTAIHVHVTTHTLEFENRAAELVLATDVTEQVRAEAELQRTHELLRGVVEQSPAPIYTISLGGSVTSWNRAAEETFGWTAAEVLGKPLPIVQAESEPEFRQLLARVRAGEALREVELVRHRRDGSRIVLDLAAAPLCDSGGAVTGVVALATDVTARKRAEEEARRLAVELEDRVRQRTAELEAANRELEAFTYSVSHDLRAPLRAIDGFSSLLEKDHGSRLEAEGRRLLAGVRSNSSRLSALLTDLLALSRAGRKGLSHERIAMRPLASAALLESLTGDSEGLEIVWGSLPDAWGDPSLLRQVWVNLISNAVKFSAERAERRIEIGADTADGEVRYFVRDNGIGFSDHDAESLFGVFQRLPGSERFEGNGVGLALVQRVVTRHGGRVWARGVLGEGACFYFTLPNSA